MISLYSYLGTLKVHSLQWPLARGYIIIRMFTSVLKMLSHVLNHILERVNALNRECFAVPKFENNMFSIYLSLLLFEYVSVHWQWYRDTGVCAHHTQTNITSLWWASSMYVCTLNAVTMYCIYILYIWCYIKLTWTCGNTNRHGLFLTPL